MDLNKENMIYEAIKKNFYEKHKANIEKGDYDQRDLDRLKADINNDWMKAFYKHGFSSNDKTVAIIHDVLSWRKEFEANELLNPSKLAFPQEFLQKGSVFYRNEDINCNPILHFAVRLHKKDQFPYVQVCKFIAYHFELAYRFNETDPIVLLFDMSEAGYSNLDMDMIKFIISCLKTYYPGLIDYMVVFQMPFIFNAAWKIIKNWLPPEGVKLIKFCDKKSIREYIQESQLFLHMGGSDTFKYSYDPKQYTLTEERLKKRGFQSAISMKSPLSSTSIATTITAISEQYANIKPMTAQISIENANDDLASDLVISVDDTTSPLQQQPIIHTVELSKSDVNFTLNDDVSLAKKDDSTSTITLKKSEDTKSIKSVRSNRMSGAINKLHDASKVSGINFENVFATPLLSISPGDDLIFNVNDGKADVVQFIKLTNTSGASLAYKVKITSPDKFRVKPGTGIIQSSSCVQITISFLKEFHLLNAGNKDKFLILWTPIDEQNVQQTELNNYWKQIIQKNTNLNEHKIRCIIIPPSLNAKSAPSSSKTVGESSRSFNQATAIKLNQILGENLVDNDNHLSAEQLQISDAQLTVSKIYSIELNMMNVLNRQNEILKKQSTLMLLILLLSLFNIIQFLFQSDLFNKSIKPIIQGIFFSKS